MKDYTKYDFEAIRGAYVEMEVAPAENPAIHAAISGMVVYQDPNLILVLRNSGTVTGFFRSEIVPDSLSARIKVEDMSVKQLKRFIKPRMCCREAMLIAEDGVHHSLRDSYGEITYDYDEFDKSFADYVDCTDWGWRK